MMRNVPVNSYIIRIYRKGRGYPRLLVGIVEEVGTKGKKAFNDLDDLWTILNSKGHDVSLNGGGKNRVLKEEK